jgi:hypothetical protein
LASRPVLLTNVATGLVGFSMYGILLAGPQLVQVPASTGYGLGRSVLVAGLLSLPASVVVVLTPLVATRVINRSGVRITLTLGVLLLVAAYGAGAWWHSSTTALMVTTALVLGGVGLCFSAVPLLLAEHQRGGDHRRDVVVVRNRHRHPDQHGDRTAGRPSVGIGLRRGLRRLRHRERIGASPDRRSEDRAVNRLSTGRHTAASSPASAPIF